MDELYTPITITVTGDLARSFREAARDDEVSLADLIVHVMSDVSEQASHGLLVTERTEDTDTAILNTWQQDNVTVVG